MALIEVRNVRQIPGESTRRWLSSRDFDLIVWFSEDEGFIGFELCYDKMRLEHALVWTKAAGFRHMAVDDGEHRPGKHKASPLAKLSQPIFGVLEYSGPSNLRSASRLIYFVN